MTFKPLLAVSAIALMISSGAMADTAKKDMNKDYYAKPAATGYTTPEADDSEMTKDVKRGLNKAGSEMRETADEIRAFFVDADAKDVKPVSYSVDMTAKGMIGKKIVRPNGDNIAKVHDILLQPDGTATKVIVSDGGLLGIGDKLAAFDYGTVIGKTDDGKVSMNISQDMIDQAAKFSYDVKDAEKANVLPANSISAKDLLDGEIKDASGKKVATIDNLTIVDGKATHVIAGYDKVLGMGGDLAALKFDALTYEKKKGETDISLNANVATKFEAFRNKTAAK